MPQVRLNFYKVTALPANPAADSIYYVIDASGYVTWYVTDLSGVARSIGNGVAPAFTVLTDGATVTLTVDATKTIQNAKVTLGGNRTLAISGAVNGMTGVLIVKQDATGSRTLALPATSKVISGGAGTLTATANAIDILSWVYDGTNYFWTASKNFS